MYNKQEIKNDMTKERRCDFAMTLYMMFFVSVQVAALSDYIETNVILELSGTHGLSILFK